MKKLTLALTVAAAVAAMPTAYGVGTMSLSDGGTTVTITDNGLGDSNPVIGAVTYVGAVGGNWLVNITTGLSKPVVGSATVPKMDLNSVNATSGGAGTLTIKWSDDNFGPLGSESFQSSAGGTALAPGASVTVNTYGDTGNAIFGNDGTTAQSSQTFNSVPFAGAVAAPQGGPLPASYSLTMEAVIVHTANGSSGFNAVLQAVPDGGSTLMLFGSALGALGLLNWRRRK